ncbi:FCS-Like Zinc finger 6-like [Tasmannia lanceolata]|uniref:FCS-Like Zinc finger 6-like n=1 Tax=Tasmannia lanceolata TaxID=3420 RepID=UPI004062CB42
MMLGKRPRPHMRRTTSMKEFTVDLPPIDPSPPFITYTPKESHKPTPEIVTSHFLRACGLCKRRLAPGRDIYMYRGDTAFCSLECRQQQLNQDERKEKCSFSSIVKEASSTAGSEASSNGERVAAA